MQGKDYTFADCFRKGFTLAEVLITLGIIGVVAAMTLPTLISKYQKKILTERAKVSFSILQEGFKKAMVDGGIENFKDSSLLDACFQDYDKCNNEMKKYFKIVETPETRLGFSLYSCSRLGKSLMTYAYLHKDNTCYAPSLRYNIFVLEGGFVFGYDSYAFMYDPDSSTHNPNKTDIYVDTNGLKGPNTMGRDIFIFTLFQDGTLVGYKSDRFYELDYKFGGEYMPPFRIKLEKFKNCIWPKASGTSCSAFLIEKGWVMDY